MTQLKNAHAQNADVETIAASIRAEADALEPQAIRSAEARVKERLFAYRAGAQSGEAPPAAAELGVIEGCADFQALIPAYLKGRLSESRALLLVDHTRTCLPCRKALKIAKSGEPAGAVGPQGSPVRTRFASAARFARPLALAAAVALGAGLVALAASLVRSQREASIEMARVDTIDGMLLLVEPSSSRALASGQPLKAHQEVRTAKGSGAVVVLRDGSRIELRERSAMSLNVKDDGTAVELSRGSVIVEAAKQRKGHLYVSTPDCLVSVVGTVFSVNHGTKGSRVAVLEGEVHVKAGQKETVLRPGDQNATHPSVEPVPLADEVSWSRHAERYTAFLLELRSVRQELAQKAGETRPRHETRLLDSVPEGTVAFLSAPNLGTTAADFYDILERRVSANPALALWWAEGPGAAGRREEIRRSVETIRTFSQQLGDEFVLALAMREGTGEGPNSATAPLFLARVTGRNFKEYLSGEVANLNHTLAEKAQEHVASGRHAVHGASARHARHNGGAAPRLVLVEDPRSLGNIATVAGNDLYLWAGDELFAASPSPAVLARVAGAGTSPFAGGRFYARLADQYRSGVDWLLGVDVKALLGRATQGSQHLEAWSKTGLLDMEHLIIEHASDGSPKSGLGGDRATLTFDKPRRGLAAWLAPAASMGSLDFVSPEAHLAVAAVVKTPEILVDDLFSFFETTQPTFRGELAKLEAELGLEIKRDLAAPLGGELAFALDGPMLPAPSWKLIVETYDPALLATVMERLAQEINRHARKDGSATEDVVTAAHEDINGRTYYSLRFSKAPVSLHYTFVDGYLVMAGERGLLDHAIQGREAGHTLRASGRFTELLPKDGHVNFSAVLYHNLGKAMSSLARTLAGANPGSQKQLGESLAAAAASSGAGLAFAYAEPEAITFGSSGNGFMGLDLATLAAARNILPR